MSSLFESEEPKQEGTDHAKPSEPLLPILDGPAISILDEGGAGENSDEPYVLSETHPLTVAETVRSSGLAWSAAIALVAAVIVMLLIGWGADLLFGSSPWGIVIGIVIGALIGFVQFFRITGEIFKK